MRALVRRWWCVLSAGGHLRVTDRTGGRVQERCYLCGAALGPGWDFSDRRAPRVGAPAHPPAMSLSDAAAGVAPSRGDSGRRVRRPERLRRVV